MNAHAALYTDTVGWAHRKAYGQYFTEARVARFMVNWLLQQGGNSLFDPAFGLGAFYDACMDLQQSPDFMANDMDEKVIAHFHLARRPQNIKVRLGNYLTDWGEQHQAIVCNPPYMKFQKVQDRTQIWGLFERHLGLRLSGYTNMASAFLLKSIHELRPGGVLAYILPMEFLNAGYGRVIKEALTSQGHLNAVIRMDCEKEIFPDAITSVGVIFFTKTIAPNHPVAFYSLKSLSELERLNEIQPSSLIENAALDSEAKWGRHFEATQLKTRSSKLAVLRDYGHFARGIATGANEFFAMRPSVQHALAIPDNEVAPCITKSKQVRRAIFDHDDMKELADSDAPALLFKGGVMLSQAGQAYVKQGEAQGLHLRYLTKMRTPWYKPENRQPAPIWFGVFSRGGFKAIRNYTQALNLTCFHGFQPNMAGLKYVDHLFLYLNSVAGSKILATNMRTYGDALDKFEPNDLNKAQVPCFEWFDAWSSDEVNRELDSIRWTGALTSAGQGKFDELLGAD